MDLLKLCSQTLHGQLEPVWGPDPVVMHDHSFAQESNGWGDSDADEWADGDDDDDDDDDDDVASESWPFDMTIFMGDLNYRVNLSRRTMARFMKPQQMEARDRTLHGQHSTVRANARGGGMEPILSATRVPADQRHSLEKVLRRDQLISQMENAVAFAGFNEGPITFYPTYKYDIRSGLLDSSEKRRCPSWPDRILFYRRWVKPVSSGSKAAHSGQIAVQPGDTEEVLEKEEDRVATPQTAGGNLIDLLEYGSVDVTHSDHRPVIAIFKLKFV
ncbi:SYNJ1 [Symbiodinium microadriaticum]|nr:SYNJ1 [Symbiodinium microadriaticum]